jgi:hypothetical protein
MSKRAPTLLLPRRGALYAGGVHSRPQAICCANVPLLILRNIVLRLREFVDSVTDSAETAPLRGRISAEPERLGEPLAGEARRAIVPREQDRPQTSPLPRCATSGTAAESFHEANGCRQFDEIGRFIWGELRSQPASICFQRRSPAILA